MIVMGLLKKHKLSIKFAKWKWCAKRVKILVHVVSGNTVEMDSSKIDSIKERIEPRNVKQVQQFLDMCNYYKRFVKDYANITAPRNS